MSVIHQTEASNNNSNAADLPRLDMKLEVVTLPVSDIERARRFYESLGWRLDADVQGEGFHVLQFTPPGSSSSVHVGKGISSAAPGSVQGLFLAVSDIETARADVARRGIEIGDIFHRAPGELPGTGPHPTRRTYSSYAAFSDPDGNGWLLQEVTSRLPGRVDTDAVTFASRAELVAALRRAAAAHGEHEKRMGGQYDVNWPAWYADHVFAEQTGGALAI
jgi:catechol 2,3-dioxygenase-like lactoylglutathione lyase family enzyme